MDAKITLAFDEKVIKRAKAYADKQNISLSRLTEMLLDRITSQNYQSLEDLPLTNWVNEISEGKAQYITGQKKRSSLKKEFFSKHK